MTFVLGSMSECTTVKPAYNRHSKEPQIVFSMSRWLLYTYANTIEITQMIKNSLSFIPFWYPENSVVISQALYSSHFITQKIIVMNNRHLKMNSLMISIFLCTSRWNKTINWLQHPSSNNQWKMRICIIKKQTRYPLVTEDNQCLERDSIKIYN